MDNKEYICPVCGSKMSWKGTISQSKKTGGCNIVYNYYCTNYRCGYECTYDAIDDGAYERYMDM